MPKTLWGRSFNRYTWVILYEVDGAAMDCYAPDTIQLGHTISYVAKQTLLKVHVDNDDNVNSASSSSSSSSGCTSDSRSDVARRLLLNGPLYSRVGS